MNITDHENPSPELPNFDLAYAFDDAVKPTRVTVFSDKKTETTTHWISIEKEYTRDLDTIA